MITICAKFAEEEAFEVSENVKWRYSKKRREGQYKLPVNLYGYRTINGKITVVPEQAKWIKQIYSLYLEGYGSSLIIRYLEENGVKSPTGGAHWGHNTVCSILRNEKYVGDCLIQKTITTKVGSRISHRNRGEEEMMLVRNGHTPIIDRDTWNSVQMLMNERCEHFRVNKEGHMPISDFTGFVVCAHCGSNYTVKTNHYYGKNETTAKKFLICNRNRHFKQCDSDNIPVDEFKKGVVLLTKKMKDNIPFLKEILLKGFTAIDADSKKQRITDIETQIGNLKGQLRDVSGKFDDYSTSIANQLMNDISDLTIEKMRLENELLITGSAEERTKSVIAALNKVPTTINSFEDFDYKTIFSRAYVKNKEDILMIIGNKDVTNLNLDSKGDLTIEAKYQVRITTYKLKMSVFVNL